MQDSNENVTELIEKSKSRKQELVANGELQSSPVILKTDENYIVEFMSDATLYSKKGRKIEIPSGSLKFVLSFNRKYEHDTIELTIPIDDIILEGKYLYDNKVVVTLGKDDIQVYRVDSFSGVAISLSAGSIDLDAIVEDDKLSVSILESIHSKLIQRESLSDKELISNEEEISGKLEELTYRLNRFNEGIFKINKFNLKDIALTTKSEGKLSIIELESLLVYGEEVPNFITNFLDVFEFRKEIGLELNTFSAVENIIKNVFNYRVRLSSNKINKMLHALALDDLKEYIETILK